MKVFISLLAVVVMVLSIGSVNVLASDSLQAEKSVKVTSNDTVNIRGEADAKSNRVGLAQPGETFEYLETAENGWYRIQLKDGATGWVSGKMAAIIESAIGNTQEKNSASLKEDTANAIQQDTFSLGYFSYKVPTGWQIMEEDSTHRLHMPSVGGDVGNDAIFVKSIDLGRTVMLTAKQLSSYYDKEITQYLEKLKLKKPSYNQTVKIAGEDGRIFGFNSSVLIAEKTEFAIASLVIGNGQLLILYGSEKGDLKEVKTALNSLLTEVQYTGPAPFNPKTYGSFQYRSVARKPSAYIGDKVKIRGVVVQVMGNAKEGFAMRVATSGKYDDIIYITTKANLPENLLVDDVLDLYCELTGEYTYSTVLGSSLTIPSAILEHYIIRE